MLQLYLVEVFLDKVLIWCNEPGEGKDKELTARVFYSPEDEYIIQPGRQVKSKPDKEYINENDQLMYAKHFRNGNSTLFFSYPEVMMEKHQTYPLEIEIWNNIEDENPELIGVGKLPWHSDFITYLKYNGHDCEFLKTGGTCNYEKKIDAIAKKEVVPLMQECCCVQVGEARLIVRLHSLGDSVITDIQQTTSDPDKFIVRTNKYNNVYEVEKIDPEDTENSPYEKLRRNHYRVQTYHKPVEVCTQMEACKMGQKGLDDLGCGLEDFYRDSDESDSEAELKSKQPKKRLNKIKMGEIKGPCGNPSCPVAHRVKAYIRNMYMYKKAPNYPDKTKSGVVCGECACSPDRFNAEYLTDEELDSRMKKSRCGKCGGKTLYGESCEERIEKHYATGLSPKGSRLNVVNYLTSVTKFNNPLYHNTYIVNNLTITYFNQMMAKEKLKAAKKNLTAGSKKGSCGCCDKQYSKILGEKYTRISNSPIPKIPVSLISKTPVAKKSSTLVPFTGGFVTYKKSSTGSNIPANSYNRNCNQLPPSRISPTRFTDTVIKSKDSVDSGFDLLDSQIPPGPYSKQPYPPIRTSGCGCSKQKSSGHGRQATIKSTSGCGCGTRRPMNTSACDPGAQKPMNTSGCGCSAQKPMNISRPRSSKCSTPSSESSRQILPERSRTESPQSSRSTSSERERSTSPKPSRLPLPGPTKNVSNTENITLNSTKSAPEIRLVQVQYKLTSPMIYNVETQEDERKQYQQEEEDPPHYCLEIPNDKECKCNPPITAAACDAFDCNCLIETIEAAARRAHKPFCPKYIHKKICPVSKSQEEEQPEEEAKEEVEPQPYCLPPITLGPCPVIMRPCSVPDGFSKMYKAAIECQPLPESYSEAGKVCCSKEFERIKKAIDEYMKEKKEHDMRCINKYNIDTEKRCCDKEQALLALIGKSCCGSHKMELQEKYKEKK